MKGLRSFQKAISVAAPADGTIVLIPETRHAFGMKLADGLELLVHIGLDTVNLGGEGFSALVDVNTEVKAGDPIIKVDTVLLSQRVSH